MPRATKSETKPAPRPTAAKPAPEPASLPPTPAAPIPCDRAPTRFIGCDVGKASITIFDSRDGQTRTIANRRETLDVLVASLDAACLIVCEATGGYEDALLAAAIAAGIPAHRADARKVKAFIRSFGVLGKTDALDARALASYAQERHARLARWQAVDPARERLQALILTRGDLVVERVAFANRRGAPRRGAGRPLPRAADRMPRRADRSHRRRGRRADPRRRGAGALGHGAHLDRRRRDQDRRRAARPAARARPHRSAQDRSACRTRPHPNQSGAKDGARHVRGGRPDIKTILFMPTLSAIRHDPALSCAYKRLVAAGKKKMVAIVAIMRKLLVIANAKLRDAFAQDHARDRMLDGVQGDGVQEGGVQEGGMTAAT